VTRPERLGISLWWGVCVSLAVPALVIGLSPDWGVVPLDTAASQWPDWAQRLVLRPDQLGRQAAASWWATAWLHGSSPHLWRNVAGTGLLALLGWLMRPAPSAALAWALAWPLTHVGMLLEPTLSSYVGLSGVLHAGLVCLALPPAMTLWPRRPADRTASKRRDAWVGLALLVGLAWKIIMENPWTHGLMASASSAIKVAPWAHFSGCMAGALATMSLVLIHRRAHLTPTHDTHR
jgi:hypothetical protein